MAEPTKGIQWKIILRRWSELPNGHSHLRYRGRQLGMLGAFNETLVNNPSPTALRGASRGNIGPPPLGRRIKGTGMRKEVSSHDGSNQLQKKEMGIRSRGGGWQKKKKRCHGQARGRGSRDGYMGFLIASYICIHDRKPTGFSYKTRSRSTAPRGDMLQKPVVSHGPNCITASHLSNIPKS